MKKTLLVFSLMMAVAMQGQGQTKKIAYQLWANGPTVKLYKMNNSTGKYVQVDSVANSPHNAMFSNLDTGTYLIRAVYDGSKYIPTFYPDKAYWTEASTLVLTSATDSVYGYINSIPAITNPGLASVIGQLTEGMMKRNAAGDKMAGVQVNLVDSANRVVGVKFTDANGNFTFSNMGYGTYKVHPEMVNVTIGNAPVVVVSAANPSVTVNLTLNSNGTSYTSTGKISNAMRTTIYPNPFTNEIRMKAENINFPMQIQIIDLNGKLVLQQQVQNNEPVSTYALPAGIYFLRWVNGADSGTEKLVRQ